MLPYERENASDLTPSIAVVIGERDRIQPHLCDLAVAEDVKMGRFESVGRIEPEYVAANDDRRPSAQLSLHPNPPVRPLAVEGVEAHPRPEVDGKAEVGRRPGAKEGEAGGFGVVAQEMG